MLKKLRITGAIAVILFGLFASVYSMEVNSDAGSDVESDENPESFEDTIERIVLEKCRTLTRENVDEHADSFQRTINEIIFNKGRVLATFSKYRMNNSTAILGAMIDHLRPFVDRLRDALQKALVKFSSKDCMASEASIGSIIDSKPADNDRSLAFFYNAVECCKMLKEEFSGFDNDYACCAALDQLDEMNDNLEKNLFRRIFILMVDLKFFKCQLTDECFGVFGCDPINRFLGECASLVKMYVIIKHRYVLELVAKKNEFCFPHLFYYCLEYGYNFPDNYLVFLRKHDYEFNCVFRRCSLHSYVCQLRKDTDNVVQQLEKDVRSLYTGVAKAPISLRGSRK